MATEPTKSAIRRFEIIAVVCTGLLKIPIMNWLDLKLVYIVAVVCFWAGYLFWRVNQEPDYLKAIGFSKEQHWPVFRLLTPLALLSIGVFAVIGYSRGVTLLNWHLLPVLLLYPIWGLFQQFLVMGLVAGNLSKLELELPKAAVVLIAAGLFGVIHHPFPILMAATFVLAIVYTLVYLKWRNLWWLGFYHGVVGCFFYYYVMGKDVLIGVFG